MMKLILVIPHCRQEHGMESCMKAACARAGLPAGVLPRAQELQRTLTAKQSSLGVSLNYSCVVCLHLAAAEAGKSVDIKNMIKTAGARSKPHYLQTYQNAESVLQIENVLSVQEVTVQLGVSQVAELAASNLALYTGHLTQSLGQLAAANINLARPVYPCAAVAAAAKIRGEKVDQTKLTDLSRAKKKDLQDIVEEMLKLQPKTEKSGSKRGLDLMDKIMGADVTGDKENQDSAAQTKREKIQEGDYDDDGFEEWKQSVFRKVIGQGFTQYEKYLK